jgi:hypothetical protein
MEIKEKFLKPTIMLLVLFCVSITPTILAEEVNAASSYEYQVLDLVNQERAKVGVAPLKMDNELFNAAKTRSKEIKIKFSHTRPDGSSCYSISSKVMGENIAYGRTTAKGVMDMWMNSPMHKGNILNPKYKSIGIGYYNSGSGYWVQLFSDKKANDKKVTVKKPKTPTFTLTSGKKRITVKWNKVSDASGYQIFRSTKINGPYELKKTITNKNTVKFIDINLKKSKYFYKIKSFATINGKREFSKLSPSKSKTPN